MEKSRRIIQLVTLVGLAVFGALLVLGIQQSKFSSATNSQRTSELPKFASNVPSPPPSDSQSPKVIGLLDVPAAEVLALPITRGIDNKTLGTGMAGAYPWSGPGQNGVFALAAHRVGAGGPFRHLDQVSIGDRISVTANGKKYLYRVISNITVPPNDTSVLDGPKDDSRIVLITCTPLDTFAERIVVTGQLVRSRP